LCFDDLRQCRVNLLKKSGRLLIAAGLPALALGTYCVAPFPDPVPDGDRARIATGQLIGFSVSAL
jgi:hypothetical protein